MTTQGAPSWITEEEAIFGPDSHFPGDSKMFRLSRLGCYFWLMGDRSKWASYRRLALEALR